jgi:hypothetical protein
VTIIPVISSPKQTTLVMPLLFYCA